MKPVLRLYAIKTDRLHWFSAFVQLGRTLIAEIQLLNHSGAVRNQTRSYECNVNNQKIIIVHSNFWNEKRPFSCNNLDSRLDFMRGKKREKPQLTFKHQAKTCVMHKASADNSKWYATATPNEHSHWFCVAMFFTQVIKIICKASQANTITLYTFLAKIYSWHETKSKDHKQIKIKMALRLKKPVSFCFSSRILWFFKQMK